MADDHEKFRNDFLAAIGKALGVTYEQMCEEYGSRFSRTQAVEAERQEWERRNREYWKRRVNKMISAPFIFEIMCDAHGLGQGMRP